MRHLYVAAPLVSVVAASAAAIGYTHGGATQGSNAVDAQNYKASGVLVAGKPFTDPISGTGRLSTLSTVQGCVAVQVQGTTMVAVWPPGTTAKGHGNNAVVRGRYDRQKYSLKVGDQMSFAVGKYTNHLSKWLASGESATCGSYRAVLLVDPGP